MILVDTSVWIDHLRHPEVLLAALLRARLTRIHPFVLGELAMGKLPHRASILIILNAIPLVGVSENAAVLQLIERQQLFGSGLSFIDVPLLAPVQQTPGARFLDA